MARIKLDEIVYDLNVEFRGALSDAVKEISPNLRFDEYALYKAFERAIRRRCRTWERVKDSNIDPKD